MDLGSVYTWSFGILLLLLSFIKIPKIEVNVWGFLAKKLGQALNGEVIKKIDGLENEIKDVRSDLSHLQDKIEEDKVIERRARILRFGDEVSHGTRHSKDHFMQILQDITEYDKYCLEHPQFSNNMTKLTSERIMEVYKQQDSTNDFL